MESESASEALVSNPAHAVAVDHLPMPPPGRGRGKARSARPSAHNIRYYRRGMLVFRMGDKAHFAYKLVSGAVRLFRPGPSGEHQVVEFLGPGDCFGFEAEGKFTVSAEAAADCIVEFHAIDDVMNPGLQNRRLADAFVEGMRREIEVLRNHVLLLRCQTARQKLALFLLFLCRPATGPLQYALYLRMRRRELALYLGLRPETLCRAFAELQQAKVIAATSRQRLNITDIKQLRRIAEGTDMRDRERLPAR